MLGPIDDALFYQSLGLSVVTCRFMEKRADEGWKEFQQRRKTIEELEEDCRKRCNIALVMGRISGNLLAFDADSDAALDWMKKKLPESLCGTRTSRGEQHLYRAPEGTIVDTRIGIHGLKLDLKAELSYVMAAPSKHPSGFEYQRLGDWSKIHDSPILDPSHFVIPRNNRLPPMSLPIGPFSVDMAGAHRYAASPKVPPAIEGERGGTEMLRVGILIVRKFGLNVEQLYDVLNTTYNPRCKPPFTEREVLHKATDAVRIVNEPIDRVTQQIRRDAMVSVKNPREDRCVICRKTKDGGDAEFIDKRFPGPVFMCWTDIKNSVMPEKPKGTKS